MTISISTNNDLIRLYGLNAYGYPVWIKEIPEAQVSEEVESLIEISDEKFSALYWKNGYFRIAEYHKNGSFIEEFVVVETENQDEPIAYNINASGNYVLCYSRNDSIIWQETDGGGNLLNSTLLLHEQGVIPVKLYSVAENLYFLDAGSIFYRIENGKIVKEIKVIPGQAFWYHFNFSLNGELIYLLTESSSKESKLYRFGLNGEQVGEPLELSLEKITERFYATDDNGFILVNSESEITKYSPFYTIEWTKEFDRLNDLEETDSGFILTGAGHIHYPFIVQKIEKDGSQSFLDLTGLKSWSSKNVEKVRVEYRRMIETEWKSSELFDGEAKYDSTTHLPAGYYVSKIYGDGILRDSLLEPELVSRAHSVLEVNNIELRVPAAGDDFGGYCFIWPAGSGKTMVFSDGILLGYKRNGINNVHGTTFRTSLAPGPVNIEGDINLKKDYYSIFHVKKDITGVANDSLREIYEYGLQNWPVEFGARWIDNDNDGYYDPQYDEPEYPGAEVLYSVSNTADETQAPFLFGSSPADIEIRKTVYASDEEPVRDAVFKKYLVINQGDETFEDVYYAYWADNDLGNAQDDYIGFDTTYNMMYTYNSDNYDDGPDYYGYGQAPPAIAHMMVQGPVKEASESDSAYYKSQWVTGKKNMDLSSASVLLKHGDEWDDPYMGTQDGADQMYNYLQGLSRTGQEIVNPHTNEGTRFALTGNPATGEGWYEGEGWPGGPTPADRRSIISAGPFTLAPGDTQEVAYAIFVARGTDNINSVAKLKEMAPKIQKYYNSYIGPGKESRPVMPEDYVLYQNYPNPFNATTTIRFELPREEAVSLKVYDVLGREVYSMSEQVYPVGRSEIKLTTSGLASGVYFYRLEAGSFNRIKKMILLK